MEGSREQQLGESRKRREGAGSEDDLVRVGEDALHGEFAVEAEELQQWTRRAAAAGASVLFWGRLSYDGETLVVG